MNATIDAAQQLIQQAAADRQAKLDALAARLLDGETIAPAALAKAVSDLGMDLQRLDAAIHTIEAERKREATRKELQAVADSYDDVKGQYAAASREVQDLAEERTRHDAEMRRQIGQAERRASELRQQLQEIQAAKDRLRREFS